MTTNTIPLLPNALDTTGMHFSSLPTAILPSDARRRRDNAITADAARVIRPGAADRAEGRTEVERRSLIREERKPVRLIISAHSGDLLDGLLALRGDLRGPDVTKAKTPQATWTQRAQLLKGILATRERFRGAFADIVADRL